METQTLTSQDTPQVSNFVKLLSAQIFDPTLGISTNLEENAIVALPNNADLGSGTIVAGQTTTIFFSYSSFLNGVPRRDIVDPLLAGLPPSSEGTFTPPVAFTFQDVFLRVMTSTITPAGTYVLIVGGISRLDGGSYTPATFSLTVQAAPKGKESKEKEKEKDTKEKEKEQEKTKEKEKEREKTKEKERLDTLAKPKDKDNKEVKGEKSENKEFGKDFKESKSEFEKSPTKESVKELKDDKIEIKEFNKDIIKDKDFDGGPIRPIRSFEASTSGAMEERLARLESSMAQLRHFISPELRPDLMRGALRSETDYQPVEPAILSQQLQQQATAAKQAKDNKDVEKLKEQ
jgi:hypothetical protein